MSSELGRKSLKLIKQQETSLIEVFHHLEQDNEISKEDNEYLEDVLQMVF
jgi:hypothetical protein